MKRFTEALKWRDPWFRELSGDAKLAFFYVVDNCDAAGVWEPDYRLANFCIKRDVDWDSVRSEFGNRVDVLPDGNWWLTRFIAFQYGPLLNPKNTAHLGVLRRLEAANIDPERAAMPFRGEPSTLKGPLEGPSKAPLEGAKDKDKDKDKDIGLDPEGGSPDLLGVGPVAIVVPVAHVVAEFHDLCPSLPRVSKLTDGRARMLKARWREAGAEPLEWFRNLFRKAEASDFISGRNGKWTAANLDWLITPSNCLKVIEGNYDNRTSNEVIGKRSSMA